MKAIHKILLLLFSPVIISVLLAVSGLAFHWPTLISISGVLLFTLTFIIFAAADRLLLRIKSLDQKVKRVNRLSSKSDLDTALKDIVSLLSSIPTQATLIIRGLFLSLSFWIVDLFLSLWEGGLHALFEQVNQNLIMTMVTMSISVFDTLRGKTISKPSSLSRLLTIFGAFQFYKNFLLLWSTFLGRDTFESFKLFLSNPVWFLFDTYKYHVLHLTFELGLGITLMFFGLFPIMLIVTGVGLLREQTTESNIDRKNFAIALIIFCCWLLTLPVSSVVSFIYFLMTHH